MTAYRMLAVDIDGTLVGSDQLVPPAVVEALAEASRANVRICLATGRSYVESADIWRQLRLREPPEPMILVGGAMVSEPLTGRTLYQRPIGPAEAREFAEAINEMGYVAMALVDRWRYGLDYLITRRGDHHAASRDWFSRMDVRVDVVESFDEVPTRPEPLRISTVADPPQAGRMAEVLKERFAGRLNVHAILAPNYGVTIVEAHAAGATKLTALRYVAQGLGISLGEIAAIGDDVNDLPMIRGVGLGAAMPHAPEALRRAADHVAAGGLAGFVRDLLAGRFARPGG
ncbi:MAG: HAD family phosphatase [Planctomycetes bacterium]|nr:HAD family phosphatase [Planctomycetota bacterium]